MRHHNVPDETGYQCVIMQPDARARNADFRSKGVLSAPRHNDRTNAIRARSLALTGLGTIELAVNAPHYRTSTVIRGLAALPLHVAA